MVLDVNLVPRCPAIVIACRPKNGERQRPMDDPTRGSPPNRTCSTRPRTTRTFTAMATARKWSDTQPMFNMIAVSQRGIVNLVTNLPTACRRLGRITTTKPEFQGRIVLTFLSLSGLITPWRRPEKSGAAVALANPLDQSLALARLGNRTTFGPRKCTRKRCARNPLCTNRGRDHSRGRGFGNRPCPAPTLPPPLTETRATAVKPAALYRV